MEYKIKTRHKHILELKGTRIFKENCISLKIDNSVNDSTDDFDARAIITLSEATELIEILQKLIIEFK